MRIVAANGCWVLVDNQGDEIARMSSHEELQHHWDRLSAIKVVEQRDADGNLIEHTNHAKLPRGAGQRKL